MTASRPDVLIVIATFDRADMLPGAIESALNQSYPRTRLVIVDDGSTDETPTVCDRYVRSNPQRVFCVRKSNGGCASARNVGLNRIDDDTGFVCFLDSDDRLLLGKIDREVRLLDGHPEAAFTYSDSVIHVQESGSEEIRRVAAAGRPDDFAIEHFLTSEAKSPALLYRSVVFAEHRFRVDLLLNEDSEFLQRVALNFHGVYCPEPGCWILDHARSKSRKRADLNLAVYAAAAAILREYPDFYGRYRKRIDRRMAHFSENCFRELSLEGRWDEAAVHAMGTMQMLMCRWRTSLPLRARRSLGHYLRLLSLRS